MSEKHGHCWHYQGGRTNGLGREGEDRFKCCHCGKLEVRQWVSGRDPEHGPHIDETVKIYSKGKP